jgi:hypothetical protein
MSVVVEDGYLVERFSGGRLRKAQIVAERPEGASHSLSVTTEDGQKYRTGWFYAPGIRQGRAVAWPAT